MVFKGTKGKWHIEDKQASIFDDNGKSIVCWHGVATSTYQKDEITLKANSLLISKAPEMLEMLKYLLPTFKGTKTFNDIEQLIKEATTI